MTNYDAEKIHKLLAEGRKEKIKLIEKEYPDHYKKIRLALLLEKNANIRLDLMDEKAIRKACSLDPSRLAWWLLFGL